MARLFILASVGSAGPLLVGVLLLGLTALVFKMMHLHTRLVRFYAGPPRVEDRITQMIACAAAAQYGPGWLHTLDHCRRDPVVRRVAELYFRGADPASLRSAASAQLETWLVQRARMVPMFRTAGTIAYATAMGAVGIGAVLSLCMAAGWWTPPSAVALLAFLGVMAGFPTLGFCRAMLEDPAAMTAAGVFDRELITTAFVAIIENADTTEVERRLRRTLPSGVPAGEARTRVA